MSGCVLFNQKLPIQLSDDSDGVHKCDHTRGVDTKQLDEGIVDTFVSVSIAVVSQGTSALRKLTLLQLRAAVRYCIERSICPGVSRRPSRSGSPPRRISISLTRSCRLALIRVSASSVVVISFSTDAKTKSRFTSEKASRLTARRSWRRSSRVGRPKNQQPL